MTGRPDWDGLAASAAQGLEAAGAAAGAVTAVRGDASRVFVHGEAYPGQPVVPATPFHICSCSKTFTAAVFSSLVEAGTVRWDTPLQTVVPELAFADPWVSDHCTFRDLACLRVGLSRVGIAEWGIRQDLPREERLARATHMGFTAAFRDAFSYSNLCYVALALAAERLAGMPYARLLEDTICRPLGLADTFSAGFGGGVVPDTAPSPCLEVHGQPTRVRELTGPNSEGSARVYLSARDAGPWMQALLAAARGAATGALPAAMQGMAEPQALVRAPDVRMAPQAGAACAYGRGLFVTRWHGQRLLHHAGGGRGWRHAMALAPDAHAGVMVMAAAETSGVGALALQLLETLLGDTSQDWRAPFEEAAAAAYVREYDAIEESYPVASDVPADWPAEGAYTNAVTGRVAVRWQGSRLRFQPADAPDFEALLRPLGGPVFALDFAEPALAPQPLDPPFRLRVTGRHLESSYFGRLERDA